MKRLSAAVIASIGALLLVGCMPADNGQPTATTPETYTYKGRADPLMGQPADERATQLSERFKLIQARQ